MSTKNFILKIQSPTSATLSKDYILVMNTKFTTAQFICDLQELYPPATEAKVLVLMLQGTYRMMPRQFLSVDYEPAVQNGIYLPNLFGGGNGIKIVYEEAESIPIAEPAPVAPTSTRVVMENLTATNLVVETAIALPSNSKSLPLRKTPQPQDHQQNRRSNALRPTHENTPHIILFSFYPVDENSKLKKYSLGSISFNVPVSGGREECIQLLPQIKSGLRKWLDPSNIEIVLSKDFEVKPRGTHDFHIEWNEDSFNWLICGTPTGGWILFARAFVYEKE
ncbi:hypothetical protein L211DRAFT_848726 [Terfezia boudieri ATCC MYA-4762]|uniref:Uncharacterized protein n=1 Tax=Terfezia boudieri ATCC MYA-4762 TaxID=1051890 RepID=A0A3N4LS72_9PEZI|nr:hypothetical protein L211DRAFT_848726 [Terfezia boudieri ATCC MYA-4762]